MAEKKEVSQEETNKPTITPDQSGYAILSQFGTVWMELLSDMGAEFLSFVAERVKEDVKTQHDLMHCKSPSEMQAIQSKFMQKAIEQYQVETGKLVQMSSEVMSLASKGKKA